MKDAVFNPAEWDAAGAEKVKKAPSPAVGVSAQQAAILAVVEAVEASGIDITASYSDWLAIAFALVSELGEDGRELFHRLSRFYPGYDAAEADRQYSACLRDGSREISIASLFSIAKAHGIRWAAGGAPCLSLEKVDSLKAKRDVRLSNIETRDVLRRSDTSPL